MDSTISTSSAFWAVVASGPVLALMRTWTPSTSMTQTRLVQSAASGRRRPPATSAGTAGGTRPGWPPRPGPGRAARGTPSWAPTG